MYGQQSGVKCGYYVVCEQTSTSPDPVQPHELIKWGRGPGTSRQSNGDPVPGQTACWLEVVYLRRHTSDGVSFTPADLWGLSLVRNGPAS